MAITRLWQAGLESNDSSSLSEFNASNSVSVSNTYAKTGAYSLKVPSTSAANRADVNLNSTYQIRIGFHWRGAAATSGKQSTIVEWRSSSARLGRIYADDSNNIVLEIAGTVQGVASGAVVSGNWVHLGLDIYMNAAAGWVKVYKDGNEIIAFAGNTGGGAIQLVRFGNNDANFNYFAADVYYDDLFIDDTTGESAPAAVPDRRFAYITPNGNGYYSQCTGSDGNSTDNYLLVDDQPHNSDTDYVEADVYGETDSYAMTTFTLPSGQNIVAIIPTLYARKTDSEVDTRLAPLVRYNNTDTVGSAQVLPSSYGLPIWTRFTSKPGGGDWDQASLDNVEIGFSGQGTF